MEVLLQVVGGVFFLLNKVFWWIAERFFRRHKDEVRAGRWDIASWSCYLIGVPAWIIFFIRENGWIAAGVETSGIPSMLLGLVAAIRGQTDKQPPRWLNWIAMAFVPLGLIISVMHFKGIVTVNQWLEVGLSIGYLMGTLLKAKGKANAYLWLTLMHISCAILMYQLGFFWLCAHQIISLIFILDAFRIARQSPPIHQSST